MAVSGFIRRGSKFVGALPPARFVGALPPARSCSNISSDENKRFKELGYFASSALQSKCLKRFDRLAPKFPDNKLRVFLNAHPELLLNFNNLPDHQAKVFIEILKEPPTADQINCLQKLAKLGYDLTDNQLGNFLKADPKQLSEFPTLTDEQAKKITEELSNPPKPVSPP